jgi:hypothetical protein
VSINSIVLALTDSHASQTSRHDVPEEAHIDSDDDNWNVYGADSEDDEPLF